MLLVEYTAGAHTAGVAAFRQNLRIGIGSMAVTLNCDSKVAKVAHVAWKECNVALLYRLSVEGGLKIGKRVHEYECHIFCFNGAGVGEGNKY